MGKEKKNKKKEGKVKEKKKLLNIPKTVQDSIPYVAVYKNGDVTVYQMPVIVVSQYYFSFPVYPLVTWVLSTGFLLRVVVAALSVRLSVVCSDGCPV